MKTKKTWHGKQAECTESVDIGRQRKLLESSGQCCQKFSNTHLRHIFKCLQNFVPVHNGQWYFLPRWLQWCQFQKKAYMVGW